MQNAHEARGREGALARVGFIQPADCGDGGRLRRTERGSRPIRGLDEIQQQQQQQRRIVPSQVCFLWLHSERDKLRLALPNPEYTQGSLPQTTSTPTTRTPTVSH